MPLDVFININVNDISSISEVKMVRVSLAELYCTSNSFKFSNSHSCTVLTVDKVAADAAYGNLKYLLAI